MAPAYDRARVQNPVRLWLVEPEPELATVLIELFAEEGFDVCPCRSVAAVTRACLDGEQGLIFADLDELAFRHGPGQEDPLVELAHFMPVVVQSSAKTCADLGNCRVLRQGLTDLERLVDAVNQASHSLRIGGVDAHGTS